MKIAAYLVMCIIALVTPSFGQQDASGPFTLEQSVALALDRSPAMRISDARVAAANARSSEVRTQLLPQLKFSARAAKLSDVPVTSLTLPPPIGSMVLFPSITENYSTRISLQQPLFTGFRLLRADEMASLQSDATVEDRTRDRAELVLQVTSAYWNLIRARQIERAVGSSIDQMQGHLKDLQAFRANGMATDLDIRKAKVQLSSLQVRAIEARNGVRIISMQLNSFVGRPLDMPYPTVEPADPSQDDAGANTSSDRLLAEAKVGRPELRAMEMRKQANAAGVGAARAGWYPSLSLVANYDYSRPNSRIIPPKNIWEKTWDVGVNLQWNVWDWFATTYQTAQAEANLRQTEAALVQLEDAVALDVAQSQQNAQAAFEMLRVAEEGIAAAAEASRITGERFRQGLASSMEVLDAQSAAVQADVSKIQARADLAIARAKLDRALGRSAK